MSFGSVALTDPPACRSVTSFVIDGIVAYLCYGLAGACGRRGRPPNMSQPLLCHVSPVTGPPPAVVLASVRAGEWAALHLKRALKRPLTVSRQVRLCQETEMNASFDGRSVRLQLEPVRELWQH
jgi:hypothetical protein